MTHRSLPASQQITAPYDARALANFMLDTVDERQGSLTQLSLLKLLYFAQGWYLAKFDRPLIRQDFEAWQFGPVVKVIRDEFEHFGSQPITCRASKLDLFTGVRTLVPPNVSDDDAAFVLSIVSAYGAHGAWQLSEMTHEKDSPWDRLWNADLPVGRLALRIRNDDIRDYFRTIPQHTMLS